MDTETIDVRRLNQVITEDLTNRQSIRQIVQKDVLNSLGAELRVVNTRAINALTTWSMEECAYESMKTIREQAKNVTMEGIASELIMAVLGKAQRPVPIQVVIHELAVSFQFTEHLDAVKAAGEIIGVCVNTGLYDVSGPDEEHKGYLMIKSLYALDSKTEMYIEGTKYPDPLLIEPRNWTNNNNGGYYSIHDSVVLGNRENAHNKYQALDALNIVQQVKLELDEYILEFDEEPNSELKTREQCDAFKLMANLSEESYNNMLAQGNSFYFQWRFDTRGRMYSSGYQINIQGTSYKKALLNTAKKQLIPL